MVGPGRSRSLPVDVAPCKGHGRQGAGKDDVVCGTPKERTFEPRREARHKSNYGINDRGLRRELCLGSNETFHEVLGQIIELEVEKRAVESSVRLRKMSVKTLCRIRPPPKRKKRLLQA
jgi:hypothetical protein